MLTRAIVSAAVAIPLCAASLVASGPVGFYGIVEKVVFEPSEAKAERIQVFGAFAYVDSRDSGVRPGEISKVARGYLYFTLPGSDIQAQDTANIRREWADLKAVAGTGQAVGFGMWGYPGAFRSLDPSASKDNKPY